MYITVYIPPNGKEQEVPLQKIYSEDEKYFQGNNIKLSIETLRTGDFALYAEVGKDEEGEPIEFIELDCGRECEDVLKSLRGDCERYLNNRSQ